MALNHTALWLIFKILSYCLLKHKTSVLKILLMSCILVLLLKVVTSFFFSNYFPQITVKSLALLLLKQLIITETENISWKLPRNTLFKVLWSLFKSKLLTCSNNYQLSKGLLIFALFPDFFHNQREL